MHARADAGLARADTAVGSAGQAAASKSPDGTINSP